MSATADNPSVETGTTATQVHAHSHLRDSPSWSVGRSALQALLAFSSLHDQIRQRRANQDGASTITAKDSELEQFALDEVLQLVAHRALAITDADGVAIALAEGNAIVCRASAGNIAPDAGMRIDLNSGFSGACLRGGQIVRCDDTEVDSRVDADVCRQLGARSMVAVPLTARQNVIGLVEAFSSEVAGFSDSNVRSLNLLAELILSALKPEEEDRLAEISRRVVSGHSAAAELGPVAVLTVENVISKPTVLTTDSSFPAASVPAELAEKKPAISTTIPELELAQLATPNAIVGVSQIPVQVSGEQPAEESRSEAEETANKEPVAAIQPAGRIVNAPPGLALVLGLILLAAALGSFVWKKLPHHSTGSVAPSVAVEPASPQQVTSAAASTPQLVPQTVPDAAQNPSAPSAATSEKSSSQPRVTGIRHWSSADSSTVVIDLQDQVQYEAHRLANPQRIYLDLRDTRLAHELDGKIIDVEDALLLRVRVAQPAAGITRVVLETKAESKYSISLEQNPYRLVVEVRKPGAKSSDPVEANPISRNQASPNTNSSLSGAISPGSAAVTSGNSIAVNSPTRVVAITPVSAGAKDLRPSPLSRSPLTTKITDPLEPAATTPAHAAVPKLRIVLDAGHGGWDLGTVGRKGLLEKDLVLDIVERVGTLIQKRLPVEVIYTRADDSYVALEKRAEIANISRADLFISVHANYSDSASARGVETYYTNTYSSVRARTAEAENSAIKLQNIDWTHVDIRAKVEQSHKFAATIQHSLFGALASTNPDIRNRGVKEAAYVVLTGTSMPAVLAEVSFVSSPTDENNLQISRYRQQIAEALYKGIAKYTDATRHVQMASTSLKPKDR